MKKNYINYIIALIFAITLTNCEETTTNKVVYSPKLTDLQKNNLKGNVKSILDTSDGGLSEYNQNGFQTKFTSVYGNSYSTREYNSNNLITKSVYYSKFNNIETTYTYTFTYDNNNLLLSNVEDSSGVKTFSTTCVNNNKIGNCDTKNSRTNFLVRSNTTNYNEDYSIKNSTTNIYTSDGKTLDGTYYSTYDNYELNLTSVRKDKDGNITDSYEYTYNYYYQQISRISMSTNVATNTNYTSTSMKTYDDKLQVLILDKRTYSRGTEDIIKYSNYVFDSHGNWISRLREDAIYSKTETRTITYY